MPLQVTDTFCSSELSSGTSIYQHAATVHKGLLNAMQCGNASANLNKHHYYAVLAAPLTAKYGVLLHFCSHCTHKLRVALLHVLTQTRLYNFCHYTYVYTQYRMHAGSAQRHWRAVV
jgi:hypothetical protein